MPEEFTLNFTSTDVELKHLMSIMDKHPDTAYCSSIMLPISDRDVHFRGKAFIKSMKVEWVLDIPTTSRGISMRYYFPESCTYTKPFITLTLIKEQ